MASPIIVRPARIDEAEALGAIGFDAWCNSAFAEHDAGRADRAALRAEFIAFCRQCHARTLVAERAGVLLGWGARENDDFLISDLWVGAHAQGQGAGAALLDALEVGIAKAGFDHVELETYAGNTGAVRFYHRHGYQTIWRGLKHSPSLNYALDKVRLAKTLAAQPDTGLPTA
ncbi:GNAT family N-acetyltransferase [Devosia limi]|nr:GNAT family N-acetyltransferase [Devosia limi]SHF49586.1 ribosomal-protein-alanine N-acetyltransferase [Devosia limi DSM 17137]